jgi:hypothetical protein
VFSTIGKRITYANVAMTLALVFAMSGGAYAAKRYLITSTKQISPSVLKQLQGKNGKNGTNGAPGPQGPQGPVGEKGANGANGTNGSNGKDGESVVAKSATAGECKEGGTAFTTAGKTEHVCNGSPWTAGGTLPKNAAERGQWAMSGTGPAFLQTGISFTVPLAAPLTANQTHFIGDEEGFKEPKEAAAIKNGECSGTYTDPGAKSGNLCVFINPTSLNGPGTLAIENAETAAEAGAGVSGAVLAELYLGSEIAHYEGSWVVTG